MNETHFWEHMPRETGIPKLLNGQKQTFLPKFKAK